MRVLVIGGYGLIGGHIVAELAAAGHQVVGAGRDVRAARRRFPFARWERCDLATFVDADWAPILAGVDAVINCAGALQDSPRDDLVAVHVSGLATLARAAGTAGVARLIHISAAGVSTSPGAFGRTKRAAEAALREQAVDWLILRPGLVLGPSAFGGSALLRGLAGFPFLLPCAFPDSLIQVVAVRDVARAAVAAIQPGAPARRVVDLVSAQAYPLRDILIRMRAWLGAPPAPVLALPGVVAGAAALAADALAWLGWRSPMRSTAMAQLRHGVRGDAASASALPGVRIADLDAILAASPSNVQERWFARLYFLKPLGLTTLALFWAASGLGGLLATGRAAAVLIAAGFAPGAATLAVVVGAAADLLLAALVCHRRTAPLALKGMVAVSATYLLGASLWRPDLWADPLGPLTKVVPTIVLALVLLGLMEER